MIIFTRKIIYKTAEKLAGLSQAEIFDSQNHENKGGYDIDKKCEIC